MKNHKTNKRAAEGDQLILLDCLLFDVVQLLALASPDEIPSEDFHLMTMTTMKWSSLLWFQVSLMIIDLKPMTIALWSRILQGQRILLSRHLVIHQ
jgi:hypothetical protein